MQGPPGGRRHVLLLCAILIAGALLAGCLGDGGTSAEEEIPEGMGLVTIWMARPDNTAEYGVQVLTAVPRFLAFNPMDGDETSGPYVDVASGWSEKEGGWEDGEWPKGARKNWLDDWGVWYQGHVPAGNYSSIRIEIIDKDLVAWNAQPPLHIGTSYESSGNPRIKFYPDAEVGVFQVQDGQELTLAFGTAIEPHRNGYLVH